MSVYKPKKSPHWHFDFMWKGRRFYGTTGCAAKRDALAYERRQRTEAALPSIQGQDITLDDACGRYADHADKQPSWGTTRYILDEMIAGLGRSAFLAEISQARLRDYFASRRASRKNSTINREIDVARAVWRRAFNDEYNVGKMPNWNDLRLRVPKQDPRELSMNEEDRLFRHLREDVRGVVDFALKSGWRRAEVLGLRWNDVDANARQAKTKIKGGDVINRPLTPTLLAIIFNQKRVGPFVFTYVCKKSRAKRRKGQRYPMTYTVLREAMAEAKAAAGIEGFRFHDLRHTRGTRIVRNTGSLAAAKAALAHKSVNTTLRYAHVLDEDVRNALDASDSRTIPEQVKIKKKKT